MFPNYCFHKNANDIDYEVVYHPKSTISCAGQTNPSQCSGRQSDARSRTWTRQDIQHCYGNLLSLVAVNSHNGTKGLHPRSACAVPRAQLIGRQPEKHRHVVTPKRLNGGSSCADQLVYQSCNDTNSKQQHSQPKQQHSQPKQQQTQQKSIGQQAMQQQQHKKRLENPSMREPQSHAEHSVRGLQDASADCFNILYENVLKAVQGTVKQMMAKYFQSMVSRIHQLNAELIRQDHLLEQFRTEMLRKIYEHNETNLNQFKFMSRLVVNKQITNYRKLTQEKEERERTNAGADLLHPPALTSTHCDDSPQQEQEEPQTLKPSEEEEQKEKTRKPSSEHPILCRKPKSARATSLPDLNRMTSSMNYRKNVQKPPKRTATPGNRIQRCAFHAENETPRFPTPKRKCQCKSRFLASLQSSNSERKY